VLRRIVELRIPAAEDTQPVVVQLPPNTLEVVLDTALVASIVEILEVDMMSAQEQELELDKDWLHRQQCDTGLILEECTKVDLRYFLLCFPCFSS